MFRFVGIVVGLMVGAIFGLPALAASVEPVATVESVKGQLSLNRGLGFKEIAGSEQAKPGDSVMVSPGGHGKITYFEGCVVDVYPGAVVGVAGSCKVAMAKPMLAGLEAPVAAPVTPWWVWPVAAGLIVGAACAGFCEEEHHHHPPAKPRSEE
jgi:hypothetical protein